MKKVLSDNPNNLTKAVGFDILVNSMGFLFTMVSYLYLLFYIKDVDLGVDNLRGINSVFKNIFIFIAPCSLDVFTSFIFFEHRKKYDKKIELVVFLISIVTVGITFICIMIDCSNEILMYGCAGLAGIYSIKYFFRIGNSIGDFLQLVKDGGIK